MGKIKLELEQDGEDTLVINTAYAERYDNWRRLEEIQKLKGRVGDNGDSDEESESSEEPAEWTVEHEKDFLHTLAALKTKDPEIYSEQKFFNASLLSSESKIDSKKKNKDVKPMYLKDYERKLVLEKGGDIDEEEHQGLTGAENEPGYFERQNRLKKELKVALEGENVDELDPLFKKKEKTRSEIENEEDEFYNWLKGQESGGRKQYEKLKGLKELWSNDKTLDNEEKFLRDFLLEKKYEVDEDARIPSYEEIVKISEDEEDLDREGEFEQKYNFRFEEPDNEFIKQYPRTIKESLRKVGEKRKEKRGTLKEKRAAEKRARKEEIRELKALKRKEIEAKLQKLKKLAGEEINVNFDDIEGDFDPAAYDKRMKELFDNEYYEKGSDGEEKPCFSELSDDSDSGESDYDQLALPSTARSEAVSVTDGNPESLRRKEGSNARRRKRNSKFLNAVLKEKPLFDPNEKTFEEYFNEYYALDYEDIIGDTITRFKYRNVPANSFGLSEEEILNADDRQLNAWASLRKVTAYRSENEEKYDINAYSKKGQDLQKKRRIFTMEFPGKKTRKLKEELEATEKLQSKDVVAPQRSKTKTRTQKVKPEAGEPEPNNPNNEALKNAETTTIGGGTKKRRSRKRKVQKAGLSRVDETPVVDDNRLKAYGVNPKKFRNRLKWSKRF